MLNCNFISHHWLMLIGLASCGRLLDGNSMDPNIPRFPDQSIEIHVAPSQLIRDLHIDSLVIEECIASACMRDIYTFNSCGKVARYAPAMIATHRLYFYDETCRCIAAEATNWKRDEYTYFDHDSVLVRITSLDQKDTAKRAESHIYRVIASADTIIQNRKNKIGTCGDLHFPCGTELRGQHTVKESYYSNGLTRCIEYFDSNHHLVAREEYNYFSKGIPILLEISHND